MRSQFMIRVCLTFLGIAIFGPSQAQTTVAADWNYVLTEGIGDDFNMQGVQARNAFHCYVAMHDAWAVFQEEQSPYLLGNEVWGFQSEFLGFDVPTDSAEKAEAVHSTISHAANFFIRNRYSDSPGSAATTYRCNIQMDESGYDHDYAGMDYVTQGAAALGNYIAQQVLEYGYQDGSNELNNYESEDYEPVNFPLDPDDPGNPFLLDPNRWQPLDIFYFVDSSGQGWQTVQENETPHWGGVAPFALSSEDYSQDWINGDLQAVWYNPLDPPNLETEIPSDIESAYK
jgi:hypothetical protein